MKEEDGRSEYTDMEPGALLSGEIEHRAALSTLARQAPAFKVEAGQSRGPPREEVEAAFGKGAHCSSVRLTRSAVEGSEQ